jgi:hypothetical protein
MGSQFVHFFIKGEAWGVGGDLKQSATWLVEIDGAKIVSIQNSSNMCTRLSNSLSPHLLLLEIADTPGNVVHRAHRNPTGFLTRKAQNINYTACGSFTCLESKPLSLLSKQGEIQGLGQ